MVTRGGGLEAAVGMAAAVEGGAQLAEVVVRASACGEPKH